MISLSAHCNKLWLSIRWSSRKQNYRTLKPQAVSLMSYLVKLPLFIIESMKKSGENSRKSLGLYWGPKKSNPKECSNYHTIALISHASKVMLKILQARLQRYMTVNFQMFKVVLEKAEEPEIKLPISTGSSEKQESSRKTSISALLTTPKPSTVWITANCGKFWKRWEYQTSWPAFLYAGQEARVRSGHRTTDWFQIGKGVVKAVYCHPAYLTYMQST